MTGREDKQETGEWMQSIDGRLSEPSVHIEPYLSIGSDVSPKRRHGHSSDTALRLTLIRPCEWTGNRPTAQFAGNLDGDWVLSIFGNPAPQKMLAIGKVSKKAVGGGALDGGIIVPESLLEELLPAIDAFVEGGL